MADLFGAVKDAWATHEAEEAAKKTAKAARESRQQGLDLVAGMDYEPDLVSDHAAPYKRAQSPVADAFLSSFLDGSNPAAIQGTRAGSAPLKAQASANFKRNYGGFDALRAQQSQINQETPWAVKPFTDPVVSDDARFQGANSFLAKVGLNEEDKQFLNSTSFKIDPTTGQLRKGTPMLGSGVKPDVFQRRPELLQPFLAALKSNNAQAGLNMIFGK